MGEHFGHLIPTTLHDFGSHTPNLSTLFNILPHANRHIQGVNTGLNSLKSKLHW